MIRGLKFVPPEWAPGGGMMVACCGMPGAMVKRRCKYWLAGEGAVTTADRDTLPGNDHVEPVACAQRAGLAAECDGGVAGEFWQGGFRSHRFVGFVADKLPIYREGPTLTVSHGTHGLALCHFGSEMYLEPSRKLTFYAAFEGWILHISS